VSKPEGGIKHDAEKPDLSMISLELMEEVARVREFGARKYERSNWKKGFKVTRSCAAALRHIFQFLAGQTNDSESGHSHLAHAVCALEHAIYDMKHRPAVNDDRDKPDLAAVKPPDFIQRGPQTGFVCHTKTEVTKFTNKSSVSERAAKGRAP
jgi:hypothetical protein